MGNYSEFRSRKGIAKCSDKQFFSFITDMRNFEQYAGGNLSGWKADASHCSFSVSPLGVIEAEISSACPSSNAVYSAVSALTGKVKFNVDIEPIDDSHSGVTINVGLELSPFLRIAMGSQIESYLDRFIEEMENFTNYRKENNGQG